MEQDRSGDSEDERERQRDATASGPRAKRLQQDYGRGEPPECIRD
jgi:hypothetical protein